MLLKELMGVLGLVGGKVGIGNGGKVNVRKSVCLMFVSYL